MAGGGIDQTLQFADVGHTPLTGSGSVSQSAGATGELTGLCQGVEPIFRSQACGIFQPGESGQAVTYGSIRIVVESRARPGNSFADRGVVAVCVTERLACSSQTHQFLAGRHGGEIRIRNFNGRVRRQCDDGLKKGIMVGLDDRASWISDERQKPDRTRHPPEVRKRPRPETWAALGAHPA